MPLWDSTDTGQPIFATKNSKIRLADIVGTESGWEHIRTYTDANGNLRNKSEVLVSMHDLPTDLAAGTIIAISWVGNLTPVDNADDVVGVLVEYNENIDVTGNPEIIVVNGNESGAAAGNLTLAFVSGTGTNNLLFQATVGATFGATDVLTITPTTSNITLAGGTVKDAGTSTNSELVIVAGMVTEGGIPAITVAAP